MCRLPVCKLGGVGRIGAQLNRTHTYIARENRLGGNCSVDRGCEQHNSAFFVGPEFNRGFRFIDLRRAFSRRGPPSQSDSAGYTSMNCGLSNDTEQSATGPRSFRKRSPLSPLRHRQTHYGSQKLSDFLHIFRKKHAGLPQSGLPHAGSTAQNQVLKRKTASALCCDESIGYWQSRNITATDGYWPSSTDLYTTR